MNAWLDVMMVPQVRPFSGEAVARVGSSKPSPYVAPGEAASIMARAPQGALTHRPNRYVQSSPWKTVTTSALTLDFRVESIDTTTELAPPQMAGDDAERRLSGICRKDRCWPVPATLGRTETSVSMPMAIVMASLKSAPSAYSDYFTNFWRDGPSSKVGIQQRLVGVVEVFGARHHGGNVVPAAAFEGAVDQGFHPMAAIAAGQNGADFRRGHQIAQ